MQANTVKPKPRPTQGSQTGIYKVDSIKVKHPKNTIDASNTDFIDVIFVLVGHCRVVEYNDI